MDYIVDFDFHLSTQDQTIQIFSEKTGLQAKKIEHLSLSAEKEEIGKCIKEMEKNYFFLTSIQEVIYLSNVSYYPSSLKIILN